jgi:hypothetical protein
LSATQLLFEFLKALLDAHAFPNCADDAYSEDAPGKNNSQKCENWSHVPAPQRPTTLRRQNPRGRTCMVRVELGKGRCRFHGGLSTGPKTGLVVPALQKPSVGAGVIIEKGGWGRH